MNTSGTADLISKSTVIIVEDEPEIREALRDYLMSLGCKAQDFESAEEALQAINGKSFDLMITDMKLPGMNGIELCRKVVTKNDDADIIVITAFGNINSALEAIEFGAEDYLLKPFTLNTLRHSIDKVFEKRRLEKENRAYQLKLEEEIVQRTEQIRKTTRNIGETFYKTVHILGNSQECREPFLRGRTERVTILSIKIARRLGWDDREVLPLLLGAPVSDIGKLAISEEILIKADPLTDEELAQIRNHVSAGENIIRSLAHFKEVVPIIRYHHERYDGSGYPEGLQGEDIPKAAAIVGLVDCFDAMIHDRPWRKGKSLDQAISEISDLRDVHFCKEVVNAFRTEMQEADYSKYPESKPYQEFYALTLPLLQKISTLNLSTNS